MIVCVGYFRIQRTYYVRIYVCTYMPLFAQDAPFIHICLWHREPLSIMQYNECICIFMYIYICVCGKCNAIVETMMNSCIFSYPMRLSFVLLFQSVDRAGADPALQWRRSQPVCKVILFSNER